MTPGADRCAAIRPAVSLPPPPGAPGPWTTIPVTYTNVARGRAQFGSPFRARASDMQSSTSYLAYPWFERAAYDRARALMVDGDYWPPDYDAWHHLAKDAMGRLSVDGVVAVRQPLDPVGFEEWCRSHDRPADSDARLTFAALCARAQLPPNAG